MTGQTLPIVLQVSRVDFIGGAERVAVTLAEAMGNNGYECVLACPEGDLMAEAAAKGIPTRKIPIDRTQITADPRRLLQYADTFRKGRNRITEHCAALGVSLVHVHHPVGAAYAIGARRALGIPLVLHVHDSLPAKPLYALLMRYALRHADAVVACSGAGRSLVERCGGDGDRVLLIPNGLPAAFCEAAPQIRAADLGGGRHVGVFAGLEPRKGQDVLLAAAACILAREADVHIWLVGKESEGGHGTFASQLRAAAARAPLDGRVHFTGFRADVTALMKAMDVVVLPSRFHESLPLSLIEAMYLGRPCVASGVGGVDEIIIDGETGRIVPPDEPQALASAILECLSPAGAQYGAAAAADAAPRFTGRVFGARMASIYDDLLARRMSPSGA